MDVFARAYSLFSGLVGALTLPGLLILCIVGLAASVWAMTSPKGRMIFFILAIFCYAVSMTSGRTNRTPLPSIVVTAAYAFKWILIIPLVLQGFLASFTGRGASILTTAVLSVLCIYIFARAFMSGSWDRYFLWIAMVIGLPSMGAQVCRAIGVSNIFRYMFWLAYISLFFVVIHLLIRPGSALIGYRYAGFLPNANSMGAYLSCMIVPGLWVFFNCSRTKLILIAIIALCLLLVATGSRTSVCQLLPVALLVALLYSKKPMMWVSFVGGVGLVLLLSLYLFSSEHLGRFMSTQSSGRVEIWQEYWRDAMESPVFGKGMGWVLEDSDVGIGPHNSYLLMFVESGAVGVILTILTLFFVILRNTGRRYYYLFPEERKMRWFLLAQLAGFLISGFFESWIIGIGYFELPFFLFTIGVKDELDRNVMRIGEEYWDKSFFVAPARGYSASYGPSGGLAYVN